MRTIGLALSLCLCACHRNAPPEPDSAEDPVEAPTDTDLPCDERIWFADGDADGWGDAERPALACEAPDGHVADASDCDDADPAVHPEAADDDCDGLDEDCDGTADQDGGKTAWRDADGDGFGDPAEALVLTCVPPPGYVRDDSDCDDADAAVFPGAPEPDCDGLDHDCDGDLGSAAMLDGVGYATIQSAIRAADRGATVEICDGHHYESLLVIDPIQLRGRSGDATRAILDGEHLRNTVDVEASWFQLADVTLRNGLASASTLNGGAIAARNGTVVLQGVVFEDNLAAFDGGAVYVHADTAPAALIVEGCTFDGNEAGEAGGALYLDSELEGVAASLQIESSTFTSNSAVDGGAVGVSGRHDASTRIADSTFESNEAEWGGGALDVGGYGDHTVVIEASTFYGNSAVSAGGAATLGGYGTFDVSVSGSVFEANEAHYEGALDLGGWEDFDVTISDTQFLANEVDSVGGALGCGGYEATSLALDRVWFEGNVAQQGGALHCTGHGSAELTFTDTTLIGNVAEQGCALSLSAFERFEVFLTDTTVDTNSCADGNYALYVLPTTTTVAGRVEMSGGAVTSNAGGLYVRGTAVDVVSDSVDWGSGSTDNGSDVEYAPFGIDSYAAEDFVCDWVTGCREP